MKYWTILLRTFLGGMSNNVSKLVMNEIPLYYFLTIRYMAIMVINFCISPKKITKDLKENIKNKKIRRSMLLSGTLSGMGTIFFYIGLKELPISMVSLLDNIFHIIFVILISVIFLKDKKTKKYYIYFIMLFPSMYMVMFKDMKIEVTFSILGIIMLLMNGLVSAIEVHITKKQLEVISVSTNVFVKTFISLMISIVCVFVFDNKIDDLVKGITIMALIYILFNVVNSYLIKMLHTKSIKEIGANQTTIFTALVPVFSVIFSIFIFGEKVTVTQWIGIIVTIFMLSKLKKHEKKE